MNVVDFILRVNKINVISASMFVEANEVPNTFISSTNISTNNKKTYNMAIEISKEDMKKLYGTLKLSMPGNKITVVIEKYILKEITDIGCTNEILITFNHMTIEEKSGSQYSCSIYK